MMETTLAITFISLATLAWAAMPKKQKAPVPVKAERRRH